MACDTWALNFTLAMQDPMYVACKLIEVVNRAIVRPESTWSGASGFGQFQLKLESVSWAIIIPESDTYYASKHIEHAQWAKRSRVAGWESCSMSWLARLFYAPKQGDSCRYEEGYIRTCTRIVRKSSCCAVMNLLVCLLEMLLNIKLIVGHSGQGRQLHRPLVMWCYPYALP